MSETPLQQKLGLRTPPIAIGYFDEPPPGVSLFQGGPVPAGCSFWREAAQGEPFYTEQPDHENCAVGAYTHNIPLSEERASELEATIGMMVEAKYLRTEEVPLIPQLGRSPKVIAYARAEEAPFAPSVVVAAARPSQAMLLYEAALRAGAAPIAPPIAGRPACAVEALTMQTGQAALSLACMGNRTFTGIGEDELYVAIPGDQWADVARAAEEIVEANQRMADHYQQQAQRFGR